MTGGFYVDVLVSHGEVEQGHGGVGLELVLDEGLDVALLADVGVEGFLVLAFLELDHDGPQVALGVEVALAHVESVELKVTDDR